MRRRGNKSSKVPNVKLRPADPVHKPIATQPSFRPEEEEESEPEPELPVASTSTAKPFRGVLLCTTGIEDKQLICIKARQLGATCTNDFTDKVTHLVAKTHGGAKYMCALERSIPILQPSWITESYDMWLRGDDVDLASSIQSHHLPIFSSIVLCTAGITSLVQRTRIGKLVSQHGGTYVKDLDDFEHSENEEKRVTHLICATDDEEDPRIQQAVKVNNKAGWMRIRIVWEEWFWDSLDFGGRFKEEGYSIRRQRQERRKPPPTPAAAPAPSAEKQSKPDDEELACVKRPPAVTLKVWASLLGPRGYELDNRGCIKLSPSKKSARRFSTPPEEAEEHENRKSVISSFRRANSFTLSQRSTSRTGLFSRASSDTPPPPSNIPQSELFDGSTFRLLGEAKSATVKQAIENAKGKVLKDSEEDEDADFIIVRLLSGSKIYRAEEDLEVRARYRTECWLEESIFRGSIRSADEHVSFIPLSIEIPIKGAERLFLSLSGLEDSALVFTQRMIRALGMNLVTQFTRSTTHLICPSGTGQKYEKALEWGVPVVNTSWLRAVAEKGRIVGVKEFLVGESKLVPKVFKPSKSAPAPLEMHAIHLPPPTVRNRPSVKALQTTASESSTSMSSPVTATSSASSVPTTMSSPATSVPPPSSSSPLSMPKELQESITTLLGKRSSPTQETIPAGKRQRRSRTLRSDRSSSFSGTILSSSFDTGVLVDEVKVSDKERVKFEDPGQRDEKARLMRMIQGEGEAKPRKKRTPGF